jgi:hypothetical protein
MKDGIKNPQYSTGSDIPFGRYSIWQTLLQAGFQTRIRKSKKPIGCVLQCHHKLKSVANRGLS